MYEEMTYNTSYLRQELWLRSGVDTIMETKAERSVKES